MLARWFTRVDIPRRRLRDGAVGDAAREACINRPRGAYLSILIKTSLHITNRTTTHTTHNPNRSTPHIYHQ